MNCLIVEDEPLAAEVLQDYVSQIQDLDLCGVAGNAVDALNRLQTEQIDLIFLDIHLPGLKGLDFLRTLDVRPKVIITSAYQEYALQGYELNVVDYLLKPVEFARFVSAVNKARSAMKPQQPVPSPKSFFFNVGKKKVRIGVDDILYIESLKEYIRIVTAAKIILTKFQLGHTEDLLDDPRFLRVHRSFIVAKTKVDAFTATDIEIAGKLIPIGRSFKEQVHEALEH